MHEISSGSLPKPARIQAIHRENERTKTIVFDAAWSATPGQFLLAWLPRFDEKPFSLVDDNPVTITVAAVGPFTRLLHRLEPGARVWLRGPLGVGFQPKGERLLLVGGGYGVAPLSFLTRRMVAEGRHVMVVIGARTSEELLFQQRLQREGADVRVSTEDGSAGVKGLVTAVVEPVLQGGARDELLACGPHGMLTVLQTLASRYQIPAQLSWEAYMRCGLGLCGSCEHEGRILCLDGPVLPTS